MSAEDIHRDLLAGKEEIGLATVYRVLSQFEAAGLVTRQHFEEGQAVFELKEGKNHHDHILCVGCGRIEEFVDPCIEKRQFAVAVRLGYELCGHSLILHGRCTACREGQSTAAPEAR